MTSLDLHVSPLGRVEGDLDVRVTIVAAQPPGIFEESVTRCVSKWQFRPGTIEGEAVNTWAETIVKFELK